MTTTLIAPTGATRFGSHFHSSWDQCQRKFFLSRLAPHPTVPGGRGLRASWTAEPLLIGDGFHVGIANYYLSGATNGLYNVDTAVTAAEATMASRKREWRSPEAYDEALAKVRQLLWNYDDHYGPSSTTPEYPNLRIFCDSEGPVVEREYTVQLDPDLPPFTCRVDAIVHFDGWLWVFEHKTTAASGARNLQSQMRMSIQGTGECWVLQKALPEFANRIQGVLLNMVVKDRGARSKEPAFYRDPLSRTAGQLEQFEWDLRNRLAAQRLAAWNYERQLAELGDPWEAARRVYIATGASTGHCTSYGRACEFLDLCAGAGQERLFAQGFDASTTTPSPEVREENARAD